MKTNLNLVGLIGLMLALFAVPAIAEDECYTDTYNNTICGVGHYMGLVFEGDSASLTLAGDDLAIVDENQNTFGIGAQVIRIESNVTEHGFLIKTYEGNDVWSNFLHSDFVGNEVGPIAITGNNLTILDIGMQMPGKIVYSVDFNESTAYVDLA